jgi:hypothetical protein
VHLDLFWNLYRKEGEGEGFERMKSLAELRKSDKNVFMNLFNSAHPDQDHMS